jgi:DNA-binding CsgD family transcriptional regulator
MGVAQLFAALGCLDSNDIDGYERALLDGLMKAVSAQQAILFMAVREPSALVSRVQKEKAVVANGWRPYHMILHNYSEQQLQASQEFSKSGRAGSYDEVELITSTAGSHRVFVVSHQLDVFTRDHEALVESNATDRMIVAHALGENVELYMLFDRVDAADFSVEDREFMYSVVPMLRPFAYRLALSLGLNADEGMEALTPREREAFLLLLGPLSEKEMASEMGLTTRSMHQYVIRVYRKLNVSSRAELTSLWLRAGEDEEDALAADQGE